MCYPVVLKSLTQIPLEPCGCGRAAGSAQRHEAAVGPLALPVGPNHMAAAGSEEQHLAVGGEEDNADITVAVEHVQVAKLMVQAATQRADDEHSEAREGEMMLPLLQVMAASVQARKERDSKRRYHGRRWTEIRHENHTATSSFWEKTREPVLFNEEE